MNDTHPWYRGAPQPLPGANPAPSAADMRAASPLERAIGGPPLVVLARLVFVSMLVGIFLVWIGVRPFEVFDALQRMIDRVLHLGWDSVRAVGDYILAGAALVIPCWLVLRLMNFRSR